MGEVDVKVCFVFFFDGFVLCEGIGFDNILIGLIIVDDMAVFGIIMLEDVVCGSFDD